MRVSKSKMNSHFGNIIGSILKKAQPTAPAAGGAESHLQPFWQMPAPKPVPAPSAPQTPDQKFAWIAQQNRERFQEFLRELEKVKKEFATNYLGDEDKRVLHDRILNFVKSWDNVVKAQNAQQLDATYDVFWKAQKELETFASELWHELAQEFDSTYSWLLDVQKLSSIWPSFE